MRRVMISISKDHGKTWGSWKYRDLGEIGEYRKTVKTGPHGMGRQFVARIKVTDTVIADLIAASAMVELRE